MDEMNVPLALLSGGAGAILATVLQQALQFWTERVRLRGETALLAIGWADDIYFRLIDLATQKNASYSAKKEYLTPEEYNLNTRQIRTLLLQGSIPARVAIGFGYGEEMRLINELRDHLLRVARLLWRATSETWPDIHPEVQRIFSEQVEPLRDTLEQRLLRSGSVSLLWKPSVKPARPNREWRME